MTPLETMLRQLLEALLAGTNAEVTVHIEVKVGKKDTRTKENAQ
jgi:hypothetical protein